MARKFMKGCEAIAEAASAAMQREAMVSCRNMSGDSVRLLMCGVNSLRGCRRASENRRYGRGRPVGRCCR